MGAERVRLQQRPRRIWLRWRVKALTTWRVRQEVELEQQRQLRELERQECRQWQHPQEAGMRADLEGRRLISGLSQAGGAGRGGERSL